VSFDTLFLDFGIPPFFLKRPDLYKRVLPLLIIL
jgi:hypothetical protein